MPKCAIICQNQLGFKKETKDMKPTKVNKKLQTWKNMDLSTGNRKMLWQRKPNNGFSP